jgi:sugar lactone lactonase YvrE
MTGLRVVMTGLTFGEQPRWHEDRLWFSDWGTQEVIAVDLDGRSEVILRAPSFPCCAGWLPDGQTLIVAESCAKRLTAFRIAADGTLSDRRVWAELGDGVPDGICADAENAVWYADVPNKRCVRVREGGEVLQTVELDRGCFACALGGADRRTLFMIATEWSGTANMGQGPRTGQILTAQAPAPGAGWP